MGAVGVRRARWAGRAATAGLVVTAVLAAPAPAHAGTATAGLVRLVSHTPGSLTTTPSGSSNGAVSTSADGGVVVFTSAAANVVSGQTDSNAGTDVFLYERSTGVVSLVSHTPAGAAVTGNASSSAPQVSSDGNYVLFVSASTNLVAGQTDTNADTDVFVYARASGVVTLVSHAPASPTTAGNSDSSTSVISGDGSVVAFYSHATDLVPGQVDTNGGSEVYVFERVTGTVSLVSHSASSATAASNSGSFAPTVSGDGAYVAFTSAATNLVTGQIDSAGTNDVFLYTRATGAVAVVSHTPAAATSAGNGTSGTPMLSADGAYVAFHSRATNLVSGQSDGNGDFDVFLWNRATDAMTLASHAPGSATTTGNGRSTFPSISDDGAVVTFLSGSTNLVTGQSDGNGGDDLFAFSPPTDAMTLVSHPAGSATTTVSVSFNSPSKSVSADGQWVSFWSTANNLVAGQDNSTGSQNLFLQPLATGTTTLVSHVPGNPTKSAGGVQNFVPAVSADGTFVAFVSGATNLITGQTDSNGASDVFLFQRTAKAVVAADFDANSRTDVSVFRPSAGAWLISGQPTVFLGTADDIPVPCDYDGDGNTDAAVFRPSVGGWYVDGLGTQFFGLSGDVPVPADFDGDGDCDIAVFRPSVGGWYVQTGPTVFFGLAGDIPVPADYDGDGAADVAIFRPSVGGWYRNGAATTFFGLSGDVPVPGDYDGNGTADVAIFRPAVGGWYMAGRPTRFLGLSSDLPQPGDYDGDGTTDIAVYRPATGAWYIANQSPVFFGTQGDIPLVLPAAIRSAAGSIAFVSTRTGNAQIFAVRPDGSVVAQITTGPASTTPAWRGSAAPLVYIKNSSFNHGNLVLRAPGGAEQILVSSGDAATPSWSPDGTKIAFAKGTTDNEIFVIGADGAGLTPLTSTPCSNFDPEWSPDGTKIAFWSARDDCGSGDTDLYVMDANGSNQTRLMSAGRNDFAPTWSPDSQKLAFETTRDGNPEIYVVNVDGSSPIRLTDNPADDKRPTWSPDGSQIAFASNRAGNFDIFVMSSSGGNPLQLTTDAADDTEPDWGLG